MHTRECRLGTQGLRRGVDDRIVCASSDDELQGVSAEHVQSGDHSLVSL